MSVVTNGTQTTGAKRVVVKPASTPSDVPAGGGWILFAGIMLLVSATLNVVWGIAAVANSHFFIGGASYILSDLNTWGWVAIGFSALEALAAVSIWRGGSFGRWTGIAIASLGVVAAMFSIPAYPLWSLVLVAIYMLVVYGLAVYGGKPV
jgi:hypothetical protein